MYRCRPDGETGVIRSLESPGKLVTETDGVRTLYDNFQRGVKAAGPQPCLGTRVIGADGNAGDYTWQTYDEVNERLTDFGSGLLQLGVRQREFVALYSQNREAWVVAEQACNAYGMVTVPLYDTLGPEAAEFIINQAEIATVVCGEDKLSLLAGLAAKCPSLRNVIVMDSFPLRRASGGAGGAGGAAGGSLDKSVADGLSFAVHSMAEVEATGRANRAEHTPPKNEDIATICYTSGTTGNPKGAMLTNRNFAASIASIQMGPVRLEPTDVHCSYLPLAHMFERIMQACAYHNGVAVGFFQGDVTKLLDDLATLRPTVFPSVPRLFNRIYDKLVQGVAVAGGIKKALFDYAYASKAYYLAEGYTTHGLWDKLVFEKVRQLLGGRVRVMITGSAPIAAGVKDFLQVVFCAPLVEGYGLTETCAVATLTPLEARYPGHVGVPMTSTEVKLVDIPEMNYTSADKPHPRGEICMRGPGIFAGYYKAPEKTAECIDADGWFCSGDVGRLNPDGTISIIDRKKNIFKLAQGEYIAPEKIENVYARSPMVAQSFVYGDSLKSKLVAVVVPDPEVIEPWAKSHGVPGSDIAEWCKSEELKKAIFDDMNRVGQEAKLRGFEVVKAIALEPEPFSVENGCLTPTFKLKRPQLKERYGEIVAAMYATLGE